MSTILDTTIESLIRRGNGEPGPTLQKMAEYGRERDFPIVGPDVGQFLRVAATVVGAERVFEFGSGFGYSAVWFAEAIPESGEIYLTDYDEENLDRAREFMVDAGHGDIAHYRDGDAIQSFQATTGPFDVVLIDHEKSRYADAFRRTEDRIADGGIVIADNAMAGPVEPIAVEAALGGGEAPDEETAGIVSYIETVRDHPAFESVLVPLGEGLVVSVKR
jgi:caffeoyl-CoA O-methyltransferase